MGKTTETDARTPQDSRAAYGALLSRFEHDSMAVATALRVVECMAPLCVTRHMVGGDAGYGDSGQRELRHDMPEAAMQAFNAASVMLAHSLGEATLRYSLVRRLLEEHVVAVRSQVEGTLADARNPFDPDLLELLKPLISPRGNSQPVEPVPEADGDGDGEVRCPHGAVGMRNMHTGQQEMVEVRINGDMTDAERRELLQDLAERVSQVMLHRIQKHEAESKQDAKPEPEGRLPVAEGKPGA